jgi:uncharacterized protein YecE (DUF72 family)
MIRIGTSGWLYPQWRGTFYPAALPHRRELEFASRRMSTLEINGSFYSLQRPECWRGWYAQTPAGFVFAVKGGRFITHAKKLRDCRVPLANFFASGLLALGEKLGPILWQLPPQLPFDAERLASFFALLPRTTRAAAELAANHDHRLAGRALVEVDVGDRPVRHAVEVRHPTYGDPAFLRVLRDHDVALCIADSAGRWPMLEGVTSDFVYLRLHGDKELYVSGYGPRALDRWAARIESFRDRDVYVYFDNDVRGRAPFDAMNLAARLGHGDRVPVPRLRQAARVATPRAIWPTWPRST